jgi:hypothetical protein
MSVGNFELARDFSESFESTTSRPCTTPLIKALPFPDAPKLCHPYLSCEDPMEPPSTIIRDFYMPGASSHFQQNDFPGSLLITVFINRNQFQTEALHKMKQF